MKDTGMNFRKKKKQSVSEKSKFFQKNWASIISVIVSVIAILISIQSNIYSKRISNSDMLIEDYGEVHNNSSNKPWYVSVYGCKNDYANDYILNFSTGGEFWISNTGGLDATLLATDFTSDIDIYDYRVGFDKNYTWKTSIYEHPNPDIFGDEISLLEMPAGKGLPVQLTAQILAFFPTENDALRYSNSLMNGDSYHNLTEKSGTWIFRFSDGKTYSKSYDQVDITLSRGSADKPQTFSQQLETSCEIMNK
jgi:hypothetical protein